MNPPRIAQDAPDRPNTLPPAQKSICRPVPAICISVYVVGAVDFSREIPTNGGVR